MYLPRASAPWLPLQPAERLTRYTTNLQRQPRQQIHAAEGMIGPPFSKKDILRPAGGGIQTESNNKVFAPRTEGTTTDDLRNRIEKWMDHRFEREITDDTVTRAYDVFVGMSDEQLAQVRADVEGAITSMPPIQACPAGQHPDTAGRCACNSPEEMVNGECVHPCLQGQTLDTAGVCACQSPNEMVGGTCRPPCVVGQGRNSQTGECEGPAEATPPPTCPTTGQHWDTGTGRCLCNAPNEMNAVGACVPPGTPQACPEGLDRNAANECVPGGTQGPRTLTAEQLAAEKRSSMVKGAVVGASAVGLGVLIYKLLF